MFEPDLSHTTSQILEFQPIPPDALYGFVWQEMKVVRAGSQVRVLRDVSGKRLKFKKTSCDTTFCVHQ